MVPGFTFQQSNYGTPVFTIRGVGFYDTSIGGSPAVSVYVDEVPLPFSVMTRGVSLDLERLEALKGPQGTLFGQNSTGGAMNYIAAKPTSELKAGADIDYGRFNSLNLQGFVSGALASNLRARVVGRYESQDGWQRGYAPNDAIAGKTGNSRLGARDFLTGRLLLDWDPTDTLTLLFNANGWRDKSDTQAQRFIGFSPVVPNPAPNPLYDPMFQFQPIPQGDARLAGWNPGTNYGRDDWFYQLSLRGDLKLGDWATLTSISAYSRYHENSLTDTDGTPHLNFDNEIRGGIKSFYQELRIAGESGKVKWLVGGNYAKDNTSEIQINYLGTTNSIAGPFHWSAVAPNNYQDTRTLAAFGSLDYALTDQLTVQASARYTDQKRNFHGCLADSGNGELATAFGALFGTSPVPGGCITMAGALPTVTLLSTVRKDLDEDNLSWKFGLNWKPNNDVMLYANVAKGYKAGSFSVLPAVFDFQLDPVTQESLLSYEAGFKVAVLDRKLQLNGAVFYYDYSDKQVLGSVVVPPFGQLPKLVNIPKSRAVGAELEVVARPIDGLRISGGVTFVDSKVRSDPPNPTDPFGNSVSFVGEAFPNTPKWQGVADAEYGFAVNDGLKAFLGSSVKARSGSYSLFGRSPFLRIDGYAVVDLRAGVEAADGSWRAQVWGRNVGNKFYIQNAAHYADAITQIAAMPATYGVSLSFRY